MLTLLWACTTAETDKSADSPADAVDVAVTLPAELPDETGETGDTAPVDTGPYQDADGDGYEAASTGGDDCDDANEWVHPGAPEYCDSIDQDCDGEPLAAGSCAMEQVIEAMSEVVLDDPTRVVMSAIAAGDLTQDGVADVRVMDKHDGRWAHYIYEGGPDVGERIMNREWWAILDDGTSAYDSAWRRFGDLNGDGYEDIGTVQGLDPITTVWYGPFVEGSIGGGTGKDTWEYQERLEWAGFPEITGEDLDGDGKDDFVIVNASGSWDDVRSFSYAIGFGGEPGDACKVTEASMLFQDGSSAGLLGDGDGDGLDELMMGERVILGSDVRLLCSAAIEDVAVGDLSQASEGSAYVGFYVAFPTGDLDADGLDEVATFDMTESRESGLRFYATSAMIGEPLLYEDAIGGFYSTTDDITGSAGFTFQDIDLDGTPEAVGHVGAQLYVTPMETLPSGVMDWPEPTLRFTRHAVPDVFGEPSEATNWEVCEYQPCADITGDGLTDLFFQTTSYDGDFHTVIRLLEGSSIPWDEPTYW